MRVPDSEVAACINEVKRINVYSNADAGALTEVIVDYFTSGHASDLEDDEISHEEESNESDAEAMPGPGPGTSIGHSDSGAVRNIDEGIDCDFIY